MTRRAALGPLVIILSAAGCGGSSAKTTVMPNPAVAAGTVIMSDYAFTPSTLRVRVGQTVTFINRGKIEHTAADTDPAGNVLSALIKPRPLSTGQRQTVTFTKPGTITYLCTFHPTLMRGRIIVAP